MMKVKSEYKTTKLGEIPGDWEFDTLDSITIEHKQGYYTKEAYSNKGTKLIRITDLRNQTINYDSMPNLEVSVADYEAYKVKPGDFLFARSGAIGRYGIARNFGEKAIFASYIIRFRFNQKKALNNFIGYFYQSYYSERQLSKITQGSSNININANNIKSLQIPLPPIKEQQKIAEILSTVDEQIEQTDQLIEKTKELKKGLMQQLLTKGIGHTEFKHSEISEIPIEWEIKTLKEISSSKGDYGIGASAIEYNLNKPRYLRITDISEDGKLLDNDIRGFDSEKYEPYILKVNDIVFARTGNSTGKSYIYKKEDGDLVYAGFLIKFSIDQNISNSQFIFYTTQTLRYKNWVSKMSVRSGQPGINSKEYGELLMPVPSLEEQHKIAEIISSVDEDIDVYEEEKSKYEELKKGLMQQLLTGKTRVKVD